MPAKVTYRYRAIGLENKIILAEAYSIPKLAEKLDVSIDVIVRRVYQKINNKNLVKSEKHKFNVERVDVRHLPTSDREVWSGQSIKPSDGRIGGVSSSY